MKKPNENQNNEEVWDDEGKSLKKEFDVENCLMMAQGTYYSQWITDYLGLKDVFIL